MGDWLGTGNIAPKDAIYRPFTEARSYVRELGLNGQSEWAEWAKSDQRPPDIPTNPQRTYKDKGWNKFGDWLGTGILATKDRKYRPFKEAREFVRGLGLKNTDEWNKWVRSSECPSDIPITARHVYANTGWRGMGDWLGTGYVATQERFYRPFDEARAFAHSLELRSFDEWREWSKSNKRPNDIPGDPYKIYKGKGWISWPNWLGTDKK